MKKTLFNISLEERANGAVETENELVFYCTLDNPEILKSATSFEDHEQWGIEFTSFNGLSVRIRNRKTTKDEKVEFVQTTKVIDKKVEGNLAYSELPIPSTQDGFEQFKMFSEKGMIKRRFEFPIVVNDKQFVFEVDCYFNEDGSYAQWVKIDLELAKEDETLADWKTLLPNGFGNVIDQRNSTPEEKQKVSEIYKTIFLSRNKS
jgi:hypothetical protein